MHTAAKHTTHMPFVLEYKNTAKNKKKKNMKNERSGKEEHQQKQLQRV